MKKLKWIVSLVFTIALVIALNHKIGNVPPLGKFLDPFHGFWQNAEWDNFPEKKDLSFPELENRKVTVLWDKRRVPHIFAENEHDLYFAQGYITALDRLWQMEFQTHATAGRLSEIVGARAVEFDRNQRSLGKMYAAENSMKETMAHEKTRLVVNAYSEGINAYIKSLEPKNYPLEYKLLDYAPEAWTPVKTSLLLKSMAWTLSGYNKDREMSNIAAKFGKEATEDLFRDFPSKVDPVIPAETVWDFSPIPISKPEKEFQPQAKDLFLYEPLDPTHGSNNWAVSSEKSATGSPILANDPHLNLNLPSIWYEIQLVAPGVNCYGVSIPGAPTIIIGFNDKIAWGVTNSAVDVADWYLLKFKDQSLNEYWHDNEWKKTKKTTETIKVRGEKEFTFPLNYSHHGPIPFLKPNQPVYAFRWSAHDPSNELLAFYSLNRAQNYDDYKKALQTYASPAQNFIFASQEGDIALWHNGKFPARWPGQGKYVSDGSSSLYDWKWIPQEQNPHTKNPERGFVSSANQHPTNESYPYPMLGGHFEHYRNVRINERLSEIEKVSVQDMKDLQNDNKNLLALSLLPTILKLLPLDDLSKQEKEMYETLVSWDYYNDSDQIGPSCFDDWWSKLYDAIWLDEISDENLTKPSSYRTITMICSEPEAKWFDNTNTLPKETLADLVLSTFKQTYQSLYNQYGSLGEKWAWGRYEGTDLVHLARIPAFSRLNLLTSGGKHIVNATRRRAGVSWKMVVSCGEEVKAWGIYPGGQSGNPGSYHYDDFVSTWQKGELAELIYLKTPEEKNEKISYSLVLKGKK